VRLSNFLRHIFTPNVKMC